MRRKVRAEMSEARVGVGDPASVSERTFCYVLAWGRERKGKGR